MKKQLCILLAFVLIFSASFSFYANAEQSDDISKTQLGTSNTYYEYTAATKTLTISGSGAIPDMKNNASSQPWYDWRSDGSIESVVVEDGITAIGNYCFFSVKANNFTLPNTLKTIGRYAFTSTDIQNTVLPFGLTSIGANAFDECTSLTDIILPDTLTSIGSNAFLLCSSLESIAIPYSVKTIGTYAFDRCNALQSVIFEDMTSSVKLSSYAFYNCPSLLEISFPSRATFGKNVYAFGSDGAVSGAKMNVYDSSNAHIYAVANSVDYTILDEKYPLSLGVQNTAAFDENTLDKVYAFTFTPAFSAKYNFYSRGECDVKAQLYNGDNLLSENDDISSDDRNFCITAQLEQGTEYTFKVMSMHSEGAATLVIYPDSIESFDICGSLTFNASDGFRSSTTAYFPVTDSSISDFVLDINFDGGYSDKVFYTAGYFDNRQIRIADTQSQQTFTCGENSETVAIGDVTGTFPVYVNHEYESTVVPYTAYEDGYTLHTCILCKDTYKSDFVPSPAVTVSGRCMLMTDTDGSYSEDIPLDNVTVEFRGNTYHTDENGYFYFRTFLSGEVKITSPYCDTEVLTVNEGDDAEFGVVALPAYDLNGDGYINGRDLAKFKTELYDELGHDYFRYAVNFM